MSNPDGGHPRDKLTRALSQTDATMLVVASVIGGGIFFTPGQVAEHLPQPGWIFAVWILGALLSLAGALANAELGAMFPRAGGDYVYLREAFHPLAGFLVGWLTFIAIYAGTIAALAAILAEGVGGRFGLSDSGILALSIGFTVAVSAINYRSVRWGASANNATSGFKILALVAFAAFGLSFGDGEFGRILRAPEREGDVFTFVALGLAMSPVLFSYLGWNASVYVASEIKEPSRNVPRSLFAGLAICAGIYVLVNATYLYALPMDALRGVGDAGATSAKALFGATGGVLVGAFALVSVLGTLNATVLVGPRIAYAMALDGLFFRGVDQVHVGFGTPTVAIVVQGAVAVALLVVLRTFPKALDFTVFAILLATIADIAALYRLRWSQPDLPRPYRAWGYPLVPALYLFANAGIAVAMLIGRPFECAVSLAMLAAGLPFYWLFRRVSDASPAGLGDE